LSYGRTNRISSDPVLLDCAHHDYGRFLLLCYPPGSSARRVRAAIVIVFSIRLMQANVGGTINSAMWIGPRD